MRVGRLNYGVDGPEFESQLGQDVFSFSETSIISLWPIRPHINGYRGCFPGVQRPKSIAEVKNEWNYISAPPYPRPFVARTWNFALYLRSLLNDYK